MKTSTILGALALVGSMSSAWASTVSFSSRPTTNALTFDEPAGYRDNWNALVAENPTAPAGYGDAQIQTWDATNPVSVSNQGLVGGTNNRIAFKYTVDFCIDDSLAGETIDFRIAPDFGHGGAAFLDGTAVDFDNGDMWWGGNWDSTSEIFEFSASLSSGAHTLEIYGQEPCCDGPTSGQFRVAGGDWQSFGKDDGLHCDVPEGGQSFILLGGALGLMAAGRRYSRKAR